MSELYDIFYAGKIADGFDESTVRANVARLFKANAQTVEKLFSGKPQIIKRGIDKQTAIKFRAALQKAGAVPLIRAHASKAAPAKKAPVEKPAGGEKKQTMAERLAALTGEPAPDATEVAADSKAPPQPTAAAPAAKQEAPAAEEQSAAETVAAATAGAAAGHAAAGFDSAISLAPEGSDVLREDEREIFEELDIDTSAIHLVPEFAEPEVETREEPPAPDTSHLSMGEVGEDIPHLEEEQTLLDPDTSHLSMGEVGEAIPQLPDEREPVDPDTSGIDLAPEGSDVLEEQYRKKDEPPPPDTSHISLED